MRGKVFLAAFLLGAGLCFVPVSGHGEIEPWVHEHKASYIDVQLLEARVSYMMYNPTNFLNISFFYDTDGWHGRKLPGVLDTRGKIIIHVRDSRGQFSAKSGVALLDQFKAELEPIYSFIQLVATDMNNDIVAKFYSRGNIPLGYFYQGEYYLWGE